MTCVNCGKKTERYNSKLHKIIHLKCEEEFKFYQNEKVK